MLTVILPDCRLAQGLEHYRVLLEPFLHAGRIALCPWGQWEDGEEEGFRNSLSAITGGKKDWRALILTDSARPDTENPFDFNGQCPSPLVRLTHFLGQQPRTGGERTLSPLPPAERPCQLLLCSTRYLPEYAAEQKLETSLSRMAHPQQPSRFWERNGYAWQSRFLVFDVEYRRGRILERDLLRFWLAVLSVALFEPAPEALHAFRLYRIELTLNEERFSQALSQQCASFSYLHKALLLRENASRQQPPPPALPVLEVPIPITGEDVPPEKLSIPCKRLGLFASPGEYWRQAARQVQQALSQSTRLPRYALEDAIEQVRQPLEGSQPLHLAFRQRQELLEETIRHEENMYTCCASTERRFQELWEELERQGNRIARLSEARLPRKTALAAVLAAGAVYLAGMAPYLAGNARTGNGFLLPFLTAMGGVILIAAAGLGALLWQRRPLKAAIREFQKTALEISAVAASRNQQISRYLTETRAAMRGWQVLAQDGKSTEAEKLTAQLIRRHRYALQNIAGQYQAWGRMFGFEVERELEPVTFVPFELSIPPEDNPVYWLPYQSTESLAGNFLPYRFLSAIKFYPEEVTEDALD